MGKPNTSFVFSLIVLSFFVVMGASCKPNREASQDKDNREVEVIADYKVRFNEPNNVVNGMTIHVPAGAYPAKADFKISTRPYTGEVSKSLTPLTPLIHVENGGGFAEETMTVTVPIKLPDGMFAMGFFVDENGEFEGIPLVDLKQDSITIATRHFSEFIIAAINELDLPEKIRTGFSPGVDDWQFPNYGSYVASGGHCAGQSITAAWYYWEKKLKGEKGLNGRYDNNANKPASPELWQDDSLGYRLASTVQEDLNFGTEIREKFNAFSEASPTFAWKAFLYSMHLTREPQYVAIFDTDEGGGHALVAYGADKSTGVLYVADPNYPGDSSRVIVFFNNVFVPYVSGSDLKEILAGRTSSYEEVIYTAKTAMIPWSKVTARWGELVAGTSGSDRFPSYGLMLKSTGNLISDGMQTTDENLELFVSAASTDKFMVNVRQDDKWTVAGEQVKIPLKVGSNRIGFWVTGEKDGSWEWADFQWITVDRIEEPKYEMEEEDTPRPVYDAVITGIYYGQIQSKTNDSRLMLFVTDETGKYPLRTAYQILSEKKDDFGNVTETQFKFTRGFGSPGIPNGRRRVCAGKIPGEWTAMSDVITVGKTGTYRVSVGNKPN